MLRLVLTQFWGLCFYYKTFLLQDTTCSEACMLDYGYICLWSEKQTQRGDEIDVRLATAPELRHEQRYTRASLLDRRTCARTLYFPDVAH